MRHKVESSQCCGQVLTSTIFGQTNCHQIVVNAETTEAILGTMQGDPMQGHPCASKMLGEKSFTSQT